MGQLLKTELTIALARLKCMPAVFVGVFRHVNLKTSDNISEKMFPKLNMNKWLENLLWISLNLGIS